MKRSTGIVVMILLCGGLLFSCASQRVEKVEPEAQQEQQVESAIETMMPEADPVISKALIFKDMYAKDVAGLLEGLLGPGGETRIHPVPDEDTSKTLIITGKTSELDVISSTMQDELESIQDAASLPPVGAQVVSAPTPGRTATPAPGRTPGFSGQQQGLQDASAGGQQTYIYHVQHGTASALKFLLDQIYGNAAPQTGSRQQSRSMTPGAQQTAQSPQFIATDALVASAQGRSSTGSTSRGGSDTSVNPWDDIPDNVDSMGNLLIIKATSSQYAEILQLIQEVDVLPVQVLLNVLIAELTLLDEEVFGVEETFFGQGQVSTGGEQNAVVSLSSSEFSEVADLVDNAVPEGFRYALLAPGRFLIKLRAFVSENRLRLLSNPHVFVRNNRKAKIYIGEDIPVVTTDLDRNGNPVEKVEEKKTGITLAVLPCVHPDGTIHLEVAQDVSDVGSQNYANTGQASIVRRRTRTTFDMFDNSMVMLGGQVSENQEELIKGIPLLKDLPLFGKLFQSSTIQSRRTELIVVIRAQIVRTFQEQQSIYKRVHERAKDWLDVPPDKPFIESNEDKLERKLRELLPRFKKE